MASSWGLQERKKTTQPHNQCWQATLHACAEHPQHPLPMVIFRTPTAPPCSNGIQPRHTHTPNTPDSTTPSVHSTPRSAGRQCMNLA